MVGVPGGESKVYVIGPYIMVFTTSLLLAPLLCFNVACAGVAIGCRWVSWAGAVKSATVRLGKEPEDVKVVVMGSE